MFCNDKMTKGNIQYTFCNKINNIYCNVSVNNAFSGLHYTLSPSQIYVIYIWSLVSQLVLSYWQPQYNWNIVERGVKYHKPTNHTCFDAIMSILTFITAVILYVFHWLIGWCLTPTLAIFQLYRGVHMHSIKTTWSSSFFLT